MQERFFLCVSIPDLPTNGYEKNPSDSQEVKVGDRQLMHAGFSPL